MFANPFLPFIRAQDRIKLFEKALILSEAGLEVTFYSTGSLKVNIKNQDPLELYDISTKCRIIPPFLGIDAKEIPQPSNKDPLGFLQMWYATNNINNIMAWDKAIIDKLLKL